MPHLPDGGLSRGAIASAGVGPHDINQDWLDDMVKRLFDELDRQLKQVECATNKTDPSGRAADSRTLASLERTLERLSRMERERAAIRQSAKEKSHDGAKIALKRKLDELLAAGRPGGAAGGDE